MRASYFYEKKENKNCLLNQWKADDLPLLHMPVAKMSDIKFTVGWVVALPSELTASSLFLEEEYELDHHAEGDDNVYIFGSIGKHNIVMAAPTMGRTGNSPAAHLVGNMVRSFPDLRFVLMVGIAGGAPSQKHDVRLGDVVVSVPCDGAGGVYQYDYGVCKQKGAFEVYGHLNAPPTCVLNAVAKLTRNYEKNGVDLRAQVDGVLESYAHLREKYARPQTDDVLYKAKYTHPKIECRSKPEVLDMTDGSDSEHDSIDSEPGDKNECSAVCEEKWIRKRKDRTPDKNATVIHYGLIASGNSKVEDANFRDKHAKENNILCFEMEAAGIMNRFPCIVIRGICDYCDTHINKKWQGYAAMVAAAYARDLLQAIPATSVARERKLAADYQRLVAELDSMQTTVKEVRQQNEIMMLNQHQEKVVAWLSAPPTSVNAANARQNRHEGTGQWFLDSPDFCDWKDWKAASRKCLWLKGMPGSGKTVLVTRIIDHLEQLHHGKDDCITIGFFYDYSDNELQNVDGMARSFSTQLYRQLCTRGGNFSAELERLYNKSLPRGEKPSAVDLVRPLGAMFGGPLKVYMVLDAMDESKERQRLVDWLRKFLAAIKNQASVKLIMTSRPETDFNGQIPSLIGRSNCVELDKTAVNVDIGTFVDFSINNDDIPSLSKWKKLPFIHQRIRDELCSKADGMFRWAALQLKEIEHCFDLGDVERALANLPKDLNTTYSRTLERLPEHHKEKAIRLLHFLLYVKRPLSLEEAVDIVAVQIGGGSDSGFHPDRRMPEPTDIVKFYPDLVAITHERKPYRHETICNIHLAHFSVKEYLWDQAGFSEGEAAVNITRTCTAYLSSTYQHDFLQKSAHPPPPCNFPFDDYAHSFLGFYAHLAEQFSTDCDPIEEVLFSFLERLSTNGSKSYFGAAPLVWASLYGLVKTLRRLLAARRWDVNRKYFSKHEGRNYNGTSALADACREGHEGAVRLLLENGARPWNGSNWNYELAITSDQGHIQILKLLVDRGADITHPGFRKRLGPLEIASGRGHLDVVRYFLGQFAADITNGTSLNDAIMAAASAYNEDDNHQANLKIVQELVSAGGSIHHINERPIYSHGTTLAAASWAENWALVRYLVEQGFEINQNAGSYGTGVLTAIYSGNLEIVEFLLLNGANVDVRGGRALRYASEKGWLEIVQLLLKYGANVNDRGNWGETALYDASKYGHLEIVQLLLKNGAEVDTRGGRYGTALLVALAEAHLDIFHLLLENGAKFNFWEEDYLEVLLTVIEKGSLELVQLFLNNRGNVGIPAGVYGTLSRVATRIRGSEIFESLPRKHWQLDMLQALLRIGQPSYSWSRPRSVIKKRLGWRANTTTALHSRNAISIEKRLARMAVKTAVRNLKRHARHNRKRASLTNGARQGALQRRYNWGQEKNRWKRIKTRRVFRRGFHLLGTVAGKRGQK